MFDKPLNIIKGVMQVDHSNFQSERQLPEVGVHFYVLSRKVLNIENDCDCFA